MARRPVIRTVVTNADNLSVNDQRLADAWTRQYFKCKGSAVEEIV